MACVGRRLDQCGRETANHAGLANSDHYPFAQIGLVEPGDPDRVRFSGFSLPIVFIGQVGGARHCSAGFAPLGFVVLPRALAGCPRWR